MAKTIIEQLLGMFPENERPALRAKLDANPKLVAQDAKTAELYSIYQGLDGGASDVDPDPAP